jgi:DNA-binding response OmpR family regulator
VLVADDEPLILRLVTALLTRHGYIVIPAEDGRSALDACLRTEGPIHLALLDVMMPGMTGPELAECLKEHHPRIDVLFMSAFRADLIAEIAPGVRKENFIAKPFLPGDLVMRVNSMLGKTEVCNLQADQTRATGT